MAKKEEYIKPVLFSFFCLDEALVSFSGLTFTRSGRNGADR